MHSQKQILLMIVLAALVMRGPINAVGPMAPVVRDVFDLPWEAFGVLAGIPTTANARHLLQTTLPELTNHR